MCDALVLRTAWQQSRTNHFIILEPSFQVSEEPRQLLCDTANGDVHDVAPVTAVVRVVEEVDVLAPVERVASEVWVNGYPSPRRSLFPQWKIFEVPVASHMVVEALG